MDGGVVGDKLNATNGRISPEILERIFSDEGKSSGQILKELRQAVNYSQSGLSKKLGMYNTYVVQYEDGKIKKMSNETMAKAIEIFGLDNGYKKIFITRVEKQRELITKRKSKPKLAPVPTPEPAKAGDRLRELKNEQVVNVLELPLSRLLEKYCYEAHAEGLNYRHRNREIDLGSFYQSGNPYYRLLNVLRLVKELRLSSDKVYALAALLFAEYGSQYRVEIRGRQIVFGKEDIKAKDQLTNEQILAFVSYLLRTNSDGNGIILELKFATDDILYSVMKILTGNNKE